LNEARVVRIARERRDAEEASLVLTALGVPHAVEQDDGGWRVSVEARDEAAARTALDDAAREPPRARHAGPVAPFTLAGVHVAVLLAAAYVMTGPRAARTPAFVAGQADARRILEGEWWRSVTALTLHGDGAHLLGNALFGALFLGALGSLVGSGVAVATALAAGACGNLLNAWFRAPHHYAVGASTAIFGVVGALSGAAFRRRRDGTAGTARAWLALGAGLGLLAMLGSSEESDVGAHLLGFAVGVPFGWALPQGRRAVTAAQVGCALASAAIVAIAWLLALR
jgi:rhomboid protease GluP